MREVISIEVGAGHASAFLEAEKLIYRKALARDRANERSFWGQVSQVFVGYKELNDGRLLSMMFAKLFRHGKIQEIKAKRLANPIPAGESTSSAYACKSVRNAIHPRRVQQRKGHGHDQLCSFACRGPRPRSYASRSGQATKLGEGVPMHRVLVAFGSNMGYRIGHIEKALMEMDRRRLRIKSVSGLYETEPMYVTDQDVFLNGVCEVRKTAKDDILQASSDWDNPGRN